MLRVHEESQESHAGDVVGTQEGARFPKRDDFVSPLADDTLDLLLNSDSVPIFDAFHTMRADPHDRDLLVNADSLAASAEGCAHQQWKTPSQRRRSDSDICCVDAGPSAAPASTPTFSKRRRS